MKNHRTLTNVYLIISMLFAVVLTAQAQTTAFNFQGRLNDGTSPANGRYDLQFRLYDALTGDNQIGAAITKANTMLINGVFSTQLNFSVNAFDGADRFIEIRLRTTGTENGYVILGPRQQILSVPYTIRSSRATLADDATHAVNADNATNATNAQNAVNAQNSVNSQQLGGVAASQYVQQGAPGTVIAFAKINGASPYNVINCYNSTLTGSAATTPPCGITVNHFTAGGYGLDFGFNTYNRPAIVTVGNFGDNNKAGYVKYPPGNFSTFDVRTYNSGDTTQTTDAYNFTVVIF